MCSFAYLAVYISRNMLGAITPAMLEVGYSEDYLGKISSFYLIFYAVGQLIPTWHPSEKIHIYEKKEWDYQSIS